MAEKNSNEESEKDSGKPEENEGEAEGEEKKEEKDYSDRLRPGGNEGGNRIQKEIPARTPSASSTGKDRSRNEELMNEAKRFFDLYKKELLETLRKGENVVYLNFMHLNEFSSRLAEECLSNPEETLKIIETAFEDKPEVNRSVRVRLSDLPESQGIALREIRSKHLNELVLVQGIIRQGSEVRPQVVNAKFECPSCGTVISVLQTEKKFREPTRCSCGRRGGFKLISKEMVDTQRLVIEEAPESLSGGEQPKRINLFLKEDLVEPHMEEKTTPGSKVSVVGVLKEVPVPLPTGGLSTRFELAIEVNNLHPMEETFEELDINEEDEKQILEMSQDPKIFERFADSVVPSIWGYKEIKKALVLQLFGGLEKEKGKSNSRGDIHILLVGDPGVAKSLEKSSRVLFRIYDKKEKRSEDIGYEEIQNLFLKWNKIVNDRKGQKQMEVLTLDRKNHKPKWAVVNDVMKHNPEEELVKIKTEHGKEITGTKGHSFLTLKDGEIKKIKGEEINTSTYLPIPLNHHEEIKNQINLSRYNKKYANQKEISEKIDLNAESGFFFGIFLSEGYIRANRTISIFSGNKNIKNKVAKFAKNLGLNPKITEDEINFTSYQLANLIKENCFNPNGLKENELKKKGKKGDYSRIKKIPEFSFFSPKDFIYGLLSGMFSGDGSYLKRDGEVYKIKLSSISKKLVQDTSDLLFSLGINNHIKNHDYKYNGKNTEFYELYVTRNSLDSFLRNVEMFRKKPVIKENSKNNNYWECIPVGSLLYSLSKKLGYNNRKKYSARSFHSMMRCIRNGKRISKVRVRKILDRLKKENSNCEKFDEYNKLRKIVNSDIVWSRVSSVETISLEKNNDSVYDISIPETNTFISNGIGVHNSVSLGFMADIAPKGRYVVGKSTSGAGITATVVRDEYLKGWSLEAGAMVLSNKGLVCIDELEKMDPEDRSAMHEAMEQQCYHKDFELTFSDGTKKKIGCFVDSLMEKNNGKIKQGVDCEILNINELNKTPENNKLLTSDFESIYPKKISKVSRHKAPDNLIKLNLNNGRELKITPEHPCWTYEKGDIKTIPARSLKKGDFFPVPGELPLEGETQEFDFKPYTNGQNLCKLLGYHISDGCYELNRGKKNGIQFWNNDKNLIDDYFSSVEKVFDITPSITTRKNQYSVRVISKSVVDFMRNLDKNLLEKGKVKSIPEKIMKCKKQDIVFLLRALFDGDGTVTKSKRNGCRVSLVTENKKLAEQVSELLLRFGITSTIGKDSSVYRVSFSGEENLKKFYSKISFLGKNKKKRLEEYIKKKKTYRSVNDIVPNSSYVIKEIFDTLKIDKENSWGNQICMNCNKHRKVLQGMLRIASEKLNDVFEAKSMLEKLENFNGVLLGRIRKKLGLSLNYVSKKLGITIYMLKKYEGQETEERYLKEYMKLLIDEIEVMLEILPKFKTLHKLAFGNTRWSKIKKLEYVKNNCKYVYDVTIEPNHSFVSNNMILHNSVTISKANVQATLRAETSVLAAANPKLGRFDPYQSIPQQIDLPPTLINRFDVIFTLRDVPNKDTDEKIASHVLKEHQSKELSEMAIPKELFRKYIAYSKQKTHPKLSNEAVKAIKEFYVNLRNKPVSSESGMRPIPISARQLGALIRMSEASAKIRLSHEVTKEDADRAIELMKYYLMQVGYDYESKSFDIDRISTGMATSERNKILLVKETIIKLQESLGKLIPIEEIEKELEGNVSRDEIDEAITKLSEEGEIFKPRRGYVQKM